jgi:outer membrane protein OmpA-like peptidoglycan-associated protein
MDDPSDRGQSQETARIIPLHKDEFAELRRLLVGLEQSQLRAILERLDDPRVRAEEVGRILPEAILSRARADEALVTALMATVEDILRVSVKKDPRTLADSLFPVMGPAIRRSIAEFLGGMLQSLNQTLENSFSLRGLTWRIESWRTGKPFAEVVLLHSLVFSVRQVFLIHRETGLLLLHVTGESGEHSDADMVSAMLTAIQDFVRDSFSPSQGDALENLQVGELKVIVEQGPSAYLAAVIRGAPPADLRTMFQENLEQIHLEFGQLLEAFRGDAGPVQAATPYLEACLQHRYAEEKRGSFRYVALASGVAALVLVVWLGPRLLSDWRWEGYIDKLRGNKGIVVVSTERNEGKFRVVGLRDDLATSPEGLLEGTGVRPRDVSARWELFQAMDPEFVLARARSCLNPPDTVALSLEDRVLIARGIAPYQWVADSRKLAGFIPGIKEYRDSGLKADYQSVLQDMKRALAPPSTVSLSMEDGVLTATGRAPRGWIEESRRLVALVPGVKEFRHSELAVDDGPLLDRLQRVLAPPETVELTLKDGVLVARGAATPQWIKDARKVVRVFPEVSQYRDNELSVDYSDLLARIRRVLAPPETISLKIVDGTLVVSGSASHQWIADTRRTVRVFPEIIDYREADLKDLDQERFDALKAKIDAAILLFEKSQTRLAPGQEALVSGLVRQLRSLAVLARRLDKTVRLTIKGHADSYGTPAQNHALSVKRAEHVASLLLNGALEKIDVSVLGTGDTEPVSPGTTEQERAANRRVSLSVAVESRRGESEE